MEIILITVGKTSDSGLVNLIGRYKDRLVHYTAFSIREMPDVKKGRNFDASRQKEAEGKAILDLLQASDRVCLLDERGREYTSVEFAGLLEKRMASGLKRLVFVIGGPYGFSEAVYERADALLSLSQMTFNHEMIRLFFTEQLYRAMTILRGEPYHHA